MKLKDLLKIAADEKASDLHLLVGEPPILRIDGELKEVEGISKLTQDQMKEMIFDVLTEKRRKDLLVKEF